MIPVRFHPIAERELLKAAKRYERERRGLGTEFRREFDAALDRVLDNPLGYASEDESGLRLCPLHRFAYSIVYAAFEDHVWVAAVAHHHRRHRYWSRRRPD